MWCIIWVNIIFVNKYYLSIIQEENTVLQPAFTQVVVLGTSHVGRGIWKIYGGGGGVPLPHQETFAFLDFKISDLVHTFGTYFSENSFSENLILQGRCRCRAGKVHFYFFRRPFFFFALQSTGGAMAPLCPPQLRRCVIMTEFDQDTSSIPRFLFFFFFGALQSTGGCHGPLVPPLATPVLIETNLKFSQDSTHSRTLKKIKISDESKRVSSFY